MDMRADGERGSGNVPQVSALVACGNGVWLTTIGNMGGEDKVVLIRFRRCLGERVQE